MSINDLGEKVKPKLRPFYTLALVLVISSIFFALGRLSALNERKTPIKILNQNGQNSATAINALDGQKGPDFSKNEALGTTVESTSGAVIGSKSGKKYYYPWCGTVKRINPENQVPFKSIAEARAAGYTPGGNCKGLK